MNYDESFNKFNEFPQKKKEFIKEGKEFAKASRQIYKLITLNSHISAIMMATKMNVSSRQVQKYLRNLQEQKKITRVGGRKLGYWKIIDDDYEVFFERM